MTVEEPLVLLYHAGGESMSWALVEAMTKTKLDAIGTGEARSSVGEDREGVNGSGLDVRRDGALVVRSLEFWRFLKKSAPSEDDPTRR
jgi:hypothetical protein